jgi:hypothetical protein
MTQLTEDSLVGILSKSTEGKLECIYLVDKDTCDTVLILMKQKLNDTHVVIPFKYIDFLDNLINLTYSKTDNSQGNIILKIKPLQPIFYRSGNNLNIGKGMSYVTDDKKKSLYDKKKSYFGEFSFGEERTGINKEQKIINYKFNANVAAQQLKDNLNGIFEDTQIHRDDEVWVIARYDDAQNTNFYFAQLTASGKVVLLPPRNQPPVPPSSASQPVRLEHIPRSNEPTIWNKYFDEEKKSYYYNTITQQSQWEIPTGNVTINNMEEEPSAVRRISQTLEPVAAPPLPPPREGLAEDIKKKYSRTAEELTTITQFLEDFIKLNESDRKYDSDIGGTRYESYIIQIKLKSENLIKNRDQLIKILGSIITNNKSDTNIGKITNIRQLLIKEQSKGYKKYYNKYLKYKQKYLEAKKLYGEELQGEELHGEELQGEELEGGLWLDKTFIFCPKDVYEVIEKLYKKSTNFNNKKFFLFLLGPRSYFTELKSSKLCLCWGDCDKNFWVDNENKALGRKFYFFSSIKKAVDQIKAKLENSTAVESTNLVKFDLKDDEQEDYKYFYFNSTVSLKSFELFFI